MLFLNKRSEGGAVGVVLIQFSKRFRPVAENGNKERHLRSPLEASSQLQKNVIVVVGCAQYQCFFFACVFMANLTSTCLSFKPKKKPKIFLHLFSVILPSR
jgi:hypothetical protein